MPRSRSSRALAAPSSGCCSVRAISSSGCSSVRAVSSSGCSSVRAVSSSVCSSARVVSSSVCSSVSAVSSSGCFSVRVAVVSGADASSVADKVTSGLERSASSSIVSDSLITESIYSLAIFSSSEALMISLTSSVSSSFTSDAAGEPYLTLASVAARVASSVCLRAAESSLAEFTASIRSRSY